MSLADLQRQIEIANKAMQRVDNLSGADGKNREEIRKELELFQRVLNDSKSRLAELQGVQKKCDDLSTCTETRVKKLKKKEDPALKDKVEAEKTDSAPTSVVDTWLRLASSREMPVIQNDSWIDPQKESVVDRWMRLTGARASTPPPIQPTEQRDVPQTEEPVVDRWLRVTGAKASKPPRIPPTEQRDAPQTEQSVSKATKPGSLMKPEQRGELYRCIHRDVVGRKRQNVPKMEESEPIMQLNGSKAQPTGLPPQTEECRAPDDGKEGGSMLEIVTDVFATEIVTVVSDLGSRIDGASTITASVCSANSWDAKRDQQRQNIEAAIKMVADSGKQERGLENTNNSQTDADIPENMSAERIAQEELRSRENLIKATKEYQELRKKGLSEDFPTMKAAAKILRDGLAQVEYWESLGEEAANKDNDVVSVAPSTASDLRLRLFEGGDPSKPLDAAQVEYWESLGEEAANKDNDVVSVAPSTTSDLRLRLFEGGDPSKPLDADVQAEHARKAYTDAMLHQQALVAKSRVSIKSKEWKDSQIRVDAALESLQFWEGRAESFAITPGSP